MSIADTFAALGRGGRPADDGLLGNCRMEWGGGEAYGEEAILAAFRAAPLAMADGKVVAGAATAAWVGEADALFADIHAGRIMRLWRLGAGAATEVEPAVAVAFDPDLSQTRGGVFVCARDHPELDPAALPLVIAAGEALVAAPQHGALHRARAFATRAFTVDGITVALFAVYRLSAGPVRTSGFAAALAVIDGQTRLIDDRPAMRDWTPRL